LETVLCERCGLVSHARIPTDAELDAFYANDYRREYHGEVTPSDRRVMRAWKTGERIQNRLSRFLHTSDRVIEVGSGIGCTVKVFDLAGHDASGIEPNVGFCNYGVQKLHAVVRQGYLFDVPRAPAYDLVLLVHVIEHFRSARAALDHIYAMLRPGGRLYVECPNLAAPFATSKRLFHFAHIFNFTPQTLTALARRCGFEVEAEFREYGSPNLSMLLVKTKHKALEIDPTSAQESLSAIDRYNTGTYHLRLDYLVHRARQVLRYAREQVDAHRFTERCIAACQQGTVRVADEPARRLAA
jgi:SAM-dependent methyltransferase